MENESALTDDLIYMIGELYVQRRFEQMKNSKLLARIEELENDLPVGKGREDDERD